VRRAVLVVCALAVLTSGCGVSGLAFRQDDRLSFVTPRDRSEVTLPLTVRWDVRDFDVPSDGSFAVFVDRAPQPPGKHIDWLARNDDACRPADGCPDVDWFEERDIFPTSDTQLTIERLPREDDGRRDLHEITVVLLDGAGRRVGETGWTVEFQVARDG
jgi:hypothetical protein